MRTSVELNETAGDDRPGPNMTAIPSHITMLTRPDAVGLPLDSVKRGFRDSNQPCNRTLAPVWRRRGQDSASRHWDGGLYCSLVVRGDHGQRANSEIMV